MTSYSSAVLHPICEQAFFAEHWERKLCHVKRNDSQYFQHLVSVDKIDHYLSTRTATHPGVQLVHSTEPIAPSQYTDSQRKINPPVLGEYVGQGATVVLSQAQEQFEALAKLSREVAKHFQMRAQTNVYLSPPGNQGFRSHYDTHDVFILQVSGRKTFRFYPSDVQLPFPDDEYDPENNPHTNVTEEVLLEAGDTLYIPRGLVHDAVAMPDANSLHVTLGVFPVIVRDVLQSCIQVMAEQNIALRETVAFDRNATCPSTKTIDVDALQEQIMQCLTVEQVRQAYSRVLDDMAIESVPLCHSLFQRSPISASSVVSIISEAIYGYERNAGTLKVRLHGQILCFEEPLSSALEPLLDGAAVRVSEMCGVDSEQQLALCAQLQNSQVLHVQNC